MIAGVQVALASLRSGASGRTRKSFQMAPLRRDLCQCQGGEQGAASVTAHWYGVFMLCISSQFSELRRGNFL
jgi:hypothetical protein